MATTYTDKERDLQWKFRWETTTELEYKLMTTNWLTPDEQADIEFELVRRGSTYVRRSYYDRPSKVFTGTDGSTMIITGGGGKDLKVYDWDNIIAAEAAYVDEVLAKPIPKVSSTDMGKFLKEQTAMIRRVIPGLIAADICGVQPMNKHVDVLPWFNMRSETFSKMDVDAIIAADKDLQQVSGHSNWMDTQKIGRSMREPQFGEPRVLDYLDLLRPTETPNTSTAISQLLETIKRSESTHASFFDTEASIDTTAWISQYKADTDKYIKDALSRPWQQDIMDDSVKFTYPNTNLCCEESSSMTFEGNEMSFKLGHTELWDMYLSSMKQASRELYGYKVRRPAIITAKAPDFSSSVMMDTASGIEPIRGPRMQDFFVGEMKAYQPDIMIHATAPVKESPTFEMKVLKNREHSVGTVTVDFNVAKTVDWAKWATLAESTEQPDPEDVRVSETLALLGIGEK